MAFSRDTSGGKKRQRPRRARKSSGVDRREPSQARRLVALLGQALSKLSVFVCQKKLQSLNVVELLVPSLDNVVDRNGHGKDPLVRF